MRMIQRAAQPESWTRVRLRIGMRFVRRYMSWLLSVWLVCQVAALAAPVVLASAGPVEQLCTCPGGDHDTCPMHHGQPDGQGTAQSGVAACHAPVDVALLSMAGGVGVLPTVALLERPNISARVALPEPVPVDFVSPHDTPPPRLQ